jgi:hypothetical protein
MGRREEATAADIGRWEVREFRFGEFRCRVVEFDHVFCAAEDEGSLPSAEPPTKWVAATWSEWSAPGTLSEVTDAAKKRAQVQIEVTARAMFEPRLVAEGHEGQA